MFVYQIVLSIAAQVCSLILPSPFTAVAVVVIRYYGSGARRGTVCQFLLGAAEPPEREGEMPQVFLSAGTVSSGE